MATDDLKFWYFDTIIVMVKFTSCRDTEFYNNDIFVMSYE